MTTERDERKDKMFRLAFKTIAILMVSVIIYFALTAMVGGFFAALLIVALIFAGGAFDILNARRKRDYGGDWRATIEGERTRWSYSNYKREREAPAGKRVIIHPSPGEGEDAPARDHQDEINFLAGGAYHHLARGERNPDRSYRKSGLSNDDLQVLLDAGFVMTMPGEKPYVDVEAADIVQIQGCVGRIAPGAVKLRPKPTRSGSAVFRILRRYTHDWSEDAR